MRKEKKKRLRRLSDRRENRHAAKAKKLFAEGVFSAARGGFGFIDCADGTSVFIPARFTGDAINGDLVKVELFPERPFRDGTVNGPAGRVVEVVERSRNSFVGELLPGFRIKSLDPKLPDFIRICGNRRGAEIGDWVKMTLEAVEDGVCYCRVEKVIGKAGVIAADLDAVCEEYELAPAYTAEENEQSAAIVPREIFRVDRRNIRSYAIDPVDAKDQDDAVSVSDLGNGMVLLGVHISDVAAYITPKSRFDSAARKRGFSCYLPGRTLPMLPAALTAKLSVGSDNDALVHTVFLTVDRATGEIKKYSREHSLMRGALRVNYDLVQEFLESGKAPETLSEHEAQDIALLLEITGKMRSYRAATELFIDLPLPECRVICDERSNRITGVEKRIQRKSEQLVEECMLAANSAIGAEMAAHGVASIYRVHSEPAADKAAEFSDMASENFGVFSGDISNRENCINFIKSLPDEPRSVLILNMLLRSMPRAEYAAKDIGHFALGKKQYCHFTSPIRRYTDLAVHQQLWNYDTGSRLKSAVLFEKLAEHCTVQEEICDSAYFSASDRMKLRYLDMLLQSGDTSIYEGVISKVSNSGLQVDVGEIGVYGFIPSEVIDRHPESAKRRRRNEYKIGDYIYIRLARVDFIRNSCLFVPAGRVI